MSGVLAVIESAAADEHRRHNYPARDALREARATVEAMAALPAKWRANADRASAESASKSLIPEAVCELRAESITFRLCASALEAAYRGEAATQDDLTPGGTVEADTDRELPGMWERADFIDNREQPATPAKGGAIDVNWLFNLIRDAEWGLKKLRIRGDDYSLGHEARSVALRLEAGDFAKARKMLNGTLQPATPAWDGECYERAYVTGYRAALRAAAAECRRIGEAIDHRGMAYVRYEDAIKCAVAVGALSPPSIVSATPAGGGDLPELHAEVDEYFREVEGNTSEFCCHKCDLLIQSVDLIRRLASTGSAPAPSGEGKRVPRIPTPQMDAAGQQALSDNGVCDVHEADALVCWEAMYSAAPTPEQQA